MNTATFDHLPHGKLGENTFAGCVYAIVNSADGRSYIGASLTPRLRVALHYSQLKKGTHQSASMQEDFNRVGADGFSAEPLFVKIGERLFVKNAIIQKEVFFIRAFHPFYNTLHNSTTIKASTVLHDVPPSSHEDIKPIAIGITMTEIDSVISKFCSINNILKSELLSKARRPKLVSARNYLYRHFRTNTNLSLSQIGKIFQRHHATVIYGINTVRHNQSFRKLTA